MLVEDLFKMQKRATDFNVTAFYRKPTDEGSDSILQLTFKKRATVKFWRGPEQQHPQASDRPLRGSTPPFPAARLGESG